MHRSKIEWVDDTWNPITGCEYGCRYCYANKKSARFSGDIRLNMASERYRKEENNYVLDYPFVAETGGTLNYPFGYRPTYHRYRLDYPQGRKIGCSILVGEQGEVFGPWIPDSWIEEIIKSCEEHPEHNYLFLTKNPERYWDLEDKGMLPARENMWYGFSYTSNKSVGWGSKHNNKHNFICVEPLLEDLDLFNINCYPAAQWVIVGAESGNGREKVIPKKEWIDKILRHCDRNKIPVFMRDSLIPIVGEDNMRREFPESLTTKKLSPKMIERLDGNCCSCKVRMRKCEMIALCARSQRGEQPKQFTHICQPCFLKLCKFYDVAVPDLRGLKE